MLAFTLRFGGTQIGTECLYDLLRVERMRRPLEEPALGFSTALVVDVAPNLIWRPRFILWHETADPFAFSRWVHQTARLLRDGGRRDVTVHEDGALRIRYPQCVFVEFDRPEPRDVAESRFSADIAVSFVTDRDPQ